MYNYQDYALLRVTSLTGIPQEEVAETQTFATPDWEKDRFRLAD